MNRKGLVGRRVLGVVLAIAAVLAMAYGVWYVGHDASEKKDADDEVSDVAQEVVQEVVQEPARDDAERFGIDENLLRRIDFNSLIAENADATRWMYVPGTKIDAPVMQERTVNQYFYNLKGLNKTYNGCGAFLVPAEPKNEDGSLPDDARLLILGHRMNSYNGEWQFSNLPTRWGTVQGASDYPYVYIYYPDHSERWRVWAGLDAWESDEIYDIPYELGSDKYGEMIQHVAANARYSVGDTPDKNTRILMMSTCNRPNGGALMRFVLVSVPDAAYYYDSGTYVDKDDERAYNAWAKAVDATRKAQIDAVSTSGSVSDDKSGNESGDASED